MTYKKTLQIRSIVTESKMTESKMERSWPINKGGQFHGMHTTFNHTWKYLIVDQWKNGWGHGPSIEITKLQPPIKFRTK